MRNPHFIVRTKVRAQLRSTPEGELFREHLSRFQYREMYETGWIPVRGSRGGFYVVGVWPEQDTAKVFSIGAGNTKRFYCLVIGDGYISNLDSAIAKVLILEADEGLFLKTANPS